MTLKEELEILRGEPIEVFAGDPMDIPCIETSDAEKLCKNPVVSVQMITYNHESYIRQAIEGVMMQKTDFEFELIIGEDCSQDKTREICFEYQKKHPDKIRVLWWHENVSKLGGNGRRCRARCRGEFIALCEGDDYWTDPLKLQKQVDVMRKHPNVTQVFSYVKRLEQCQSSDKWSESALPISGFTRGTMLRDWIVFGRLSKGGLSKQKFASPATPSAMCRKSSLCVLGNEIDIFSWRLRMGDTTLWLGLSLLGDAYVIPEYQCVYRVHSGGVSNAPGIGRGLIGIDGLVARYYFLHVDMPSQKDLRAILADILELRIWCLSYYTGKSLTDACYAIRRASAFRELLRERSIWRLSILILSANWLPEHLRRFLLRVVRRLYS